MSDIHMKNRWLGSTMSGDNDAVIAALVDALPMTDSLDADGMKRMETARGLMAELFARGISIQQFHKESGITGFPVDPKQPGMEKQQIQGSPCYYCFWLLDKDPAVAAKAVQNLLAYRKARAEGYADQMTLQLVIDIDSDNKQFPMPYDAGLSTHAICTEFSLADVESQFDAIQAACAKIAKLSVNKVRLILGTFGPGEFAGYSTHSMFSKRVPYAVGTEWLMFKNIHRRAGKYGWFWRWVARREERAEDAYIAREQEEMRRMQEQFQREQEQAQQAGQQ